MKPQINITVAGVGYVGLSLAILLSQKNKVIAYDIVPEKINQINHNHSPIHDQYIEEYLSEKTLHLTATSNSESALRDADFVIISTPTDYNDETNHFDTSSVEDIIQHSLSINPKATIIIKSTVPVGFTKNMRKKYQTDNIIFSPEFLREGKALYDNLYPSRIIIGDTSKKAREFGKLLGSCALNNPPILYMSPTEAEAVKLFANTYLALRIAYFNELDTYAEIKGLNTKNIIKGVSLDPRIGDFYNNPSFGYGGYCLPKDTKQLLSNYNDVPQNLIEAIVKANQTRKKHIADKVIAMQPQTIGLYRLTMKSGSDNYRSSAIQDIIIELKNQNKNIIIFEPTLDEALFMGQPVVNDFESFINRSDIILANRIDKTISKFNNKIYSRDLFERD